MLIIFRRKARSPEFALAVNYYSQMTPRIVRGKVGKHREMELRRIHMRSQDRFVFSVGKKLAVKFEMLRPRVFPERRVGGPEFSRQRTLTWGQQFSAKLRKEWLEWLENC